MDGTYESPAVVELGSLDDLTLSVGFDSHKTQGPSDYIISNGKPSSFSPGS
jgi:hypothetical protein